MNVSPSSQRRLKVRKCIDQAGNSTLHWRINVLTARTVDGGRRILKDDLQLRRSHDPDSSIRRDPVEMIRRNRLLALQSISQLMKALVGNFVEHFDWPAVESRVLQRHDGRDGTAALGHVDVSGGQFKSL